jgi:hypothetical protein
LLAAPAAVEPFMQQAKSAELNANRDVCVGNSENANVLLVLNSSEMSPVALVTEILAVPGEPPKSVTEVVPFVKGVV